MKHFVHARLGTVILFFTATRANAQQCCTGNVSTYCTAGTSVQGCVPSISGTGIPSVDAGSGFQVAVANLPGQRFGTIFYGFFSYITPWAPGSPSYKCVASPVQRTGSANTGATAASCNGALSLDFNQWIAANPNALGAPFLQGQTIRAQAWYRDPAAPGQTSLSDALAFTLCSGAGDTTPPVITTCASSLTLATTSGSCFVPAPDLRSQVVAVDNCSAVTIAQVPAPGAPIGLGTTPIVLRARDASQNAVTCSAVLTVVDGGAPLIASCAPSLTVPANSNCQALVPDFTQLFSVTDDCGSALVFDQVPAVGSSLGLGTYTVAITVEDVRGNQTTCTTSLSIVRSALCPNPIGFVQIQPGSFQMGSDAATGYPYYGEYDQARPPHQVTLTYPFWIGATEVTQSEYMSVMGVNPSHFFGLNRPVEQVSWDDARSYCAALSAQQASLGLLPSGYEYRLPTEAEWEYTCRAGTSTEFNVGPLLECSQAQFTYLDNWSTPCNNAPNTLPVASFPPNAWGLFDMHGNVWELCLDAFVPYTSAAKIDPFFPTGVNRIVRGGSWFYPRLHSRSALRAMYWDTSYRANYIGFRVVLGPILVP